jgi:hypothetical protein
MIMRVCMFVCVYEHIYYLPSRRGRGQHTSAYVSIRQHTSAYVSIRQHTSAYVSIRIRIPSRRGLGGRDRDGPLAARTPRKPPRCTCRIRQHTSAYVSIRQHTSAYVSIRQNTSAYVCIRLHTSAYVSIRALAARTPRKPPRCTCRIR